MSSKAMDFMYGTLIIKCHQCGYTETVEEKITDGRAIYLFNRDDSTLTLSCPQCNIKMEMTIVPDEEANKEFNDIIVEEVKNEELQEETPKEETV